MSCTSRRPFASLLSACRIALIAVLLGASAGAHAALDPVVLQLKWSHGFQFAGYYAAQELGYYRDAGLDVRIDEAIPGDDPLTPVLDGRAQFGVSMSNLLLLRQAGKPVVVLAVIFQHSPLVLVARQKTAGQDIHEIIGKRVMIERHSDELLAYLKQEGIPLERLQQVDHTFNPQDLIEGRVDAMTAYVSNELFYLDKAKMAYALYTPRSAGIDFYGDNLFTTEQEIRQNPQRVAAFRAASLRGWRYAMDHPDEIAELIHRKYSQRQPLAFYQFEARRMLPLLRPDLIEVGYMNAGRWRHIADTYADLGLLKRDFPLDGFLYQVQPKRDWWWLPLLTVMVLGSLLLLYIVIINRRLASALATSQRSEAVIRESEQKYRLLAENMADVVWTYDPVTNRFLYVSPSIERLGGYSVAEMQQLSLDAFLSPQDLELFTSLMQQRLGDLLSGKVKNDSAYTYEIEQRRKDGSLIWTEVVTHYVRNPDTGHIEIHGVSRNIEERKRAEARMRSLAQQDSLTGLANRAMFQEMLNFALAMARRDLSQLALLFLDLDKFKPVNDQFGHGVGDLLLQAVAQRIVASVRESDSVARIGGDEFVVLLRNIDGAGSALAVAEKVRLALCQPFEIDGHRLEIAASIGIALYPEHALEAIELVKHADDAMYAAKNEGRNAVHLFVPEMAPLSAIE